MVRGRGPVGKAIVRHGDERIAELIAGGADLDRVLGEVGLWGVEGNVKAGLSRAITDREGHPLIAEALTQRIQRQVEGNRDIRVRNTSLHEVARGVGIGWLSMRGFVERTGIDLNPLDDVDATRIDVIRTHLASGGTKVSLLQRLGMDRRTLRRLMQDGAVPEPPKVQPTPSRRAEFRSRILESILTIEPSDAYELVTTNELVDLYPECGNTPAFRRKAMKETKRAITRRLESILNEIKGEDTSRRRAIEAELRELSRDIPITEVVDERRRIRRSLERIGTLSEDAMAKSVKKRIDIEFFSGEDVCPEGFAVRLVRLDFFGDAREVLNPQIPTPQTLDEVIDQLNDYSRRRYGRKAARPIKRMSTSDFIHGAPSFYYLLLRKLSERVPNVSSVYVARTIRWIITGDEGEDFITDWSKPHERRLAVRDMLDSADGNPLAVTTRALAGEYSGLHDYMRREYGLQSYRDVLITLLKLYGGLTPEQERILRVRHDREAQKGLVLRYYDSERHQRHYQVLLGTGELATGNTMRALSMELGAAVDRGDSPRVIADHYGIGAHGIHQLIEGSKRDSRGLIRLTSGYGGIVRDDPLIPRWDMHSPGDLGVMLGEHSRYLHGARRHGGRSSGGVEMSPVVGRIDEDLCALSAACSGRDFDGMARHSGVLLGDVGKAREVPANQRLSIITTKRMKTTRRLSDDALDEIARLAEAAQEESKYR